MRVTECARVNEIEIVMGIVREAVEMIRREKKHRPETGHLLGKTKHIGMRAGRPA